MANIPTVPGSEIDISTTPRAVPLDAGRLAGPRLRGQQAISGAVGSIGEVAEGLQHDLMKARNAGIAADVDLKMRTARQSFMETLRNDPHEGWRSADDSAWKDRAAEVAGNVRQDIFSEHTHVPPEMRAAIESGFKSWESSFLLDTQVKANDQMMARSWGKSKEDYADALKDGQGEHASNILKLAKDTHQAPVEEIEQMERDIPRTIARNFIQNGLQNNPKGTEDLLKSGASLPAVDQNGKRIVPKEVLRPKEMEQLVNTARVRREGWQRENAGNMLATQADPDTGYVPDEVIDQGVKSGEIDGRFGANLKAAQDRRMKQQTREATAAAAKQERDTHQLIVARIHNPEAWTVDPEGYAHDLTQQAALITDPALRQDAISSINRQIESVRKKGETTEGPIERQIYERMNRDRQTQGVMLPLSVEEVAGKSGQSRLLPFLSSGDTPASTVYRHVEGGLGALNKMDETAFAEAYPGMKREDVVAAINDHADRIHAQMVDWFKTPEGQKATYDQADAHRRTLERPYVMDAVRDSLSKRADAIVTTKEERDALPPGAPYRYNGQTYIKQ